MTVAVKYFKFEALLLADRWLTPAYVGVDKEGNVSYLSDVPPDAPVGLESVSGVVLPGFQNAHSHAFQYAMAGLAETHPRGSTDDFWSWREAMYSCALSITPDQMEAIATVLYAEMLRNGYTHVAEFHYLHHDIQGNRYANQAEMGERLLAAAQAAGIKLTLVPVFYQRGNFGNPPDLRQRRFISSTVDEYFQLLDATANAVKQDANARLGFGVHSLRAVDHIDLLATVSHGPAGLPFHLHVAEQRKEIDDCVAYLGKRPVTWLLEQLDLNERFHLVHCTHMSDSEVTMLAKSGAHVVLCPGTEGNLGDGIFRLTDFMGCDGNWSLGTDSHISLNPLEDLRWMDYAQRLTTNKRNTFDDGGRTLIRKALLSGKMAMEYAQHTEFFSVGKPFDAVVFNAESPLLLRAGLENLLPTIVYTSDSSMKMGTLVNGKWIIKDQRHIGQDSFYPAYKNALKSLG